MRASRPLLVSTVALAAVVGVAVVGLTASAPSHDPAAAPPRPGASAATSSTPGAEVAGASPSFAAADAALIRSRRRPSPSPSPTPTSKLSPTATSKPSPSPSVAPKPRPSPSVTPKPTPTPTPTLTPTPTPTATPAPTGPPTGSATLHYTANGVFNGNTFSPGAAGFNLADVSSTWWVDHLPVGTKALVYVGLCNGADANFVSTITPFAGNANVYGYYLYDEPDPTGQYKTLCPAANLKAETDWIHANDPGRKVFIVLMNMGATDNPTFANTYKPANTDADLFGIDPYPCRTELSGCDYSYITKGVAAAEAWGIPAANLVPVFQTFGGGSWTDDGGGAYLLPTDVQLQQILATWHSVLPAPAFDYAYSWGSQNNDSSLSGSPSLQQVMKTHNTAS